LNKIINEDLRYMEMISNAPKNQDQIKVEWTIRNTSGVLGEKIIISMEKLPDDADKRQKNFYKDSRIMERIMETICDVGKEAKEVKKEAIEIIKEIARKAEYFEDKNDPWEYKIGYCSLEMEYVLNIDADHAEVLQLIGLKT
jgi:hypothetical protein